MAFALVTERLLVRSWSLADTEDALATYGVGDVTGQRSEPGDGPVPDGPRR